MSRTPSRIWLRRYAWFQVAATWLLLIVGAAVTSNDAGLSEPDWPTGLGYFNYLAVHANGLFKGRVVFEHGHREVGMVIGLVTLIETVWLLKSTTRPLLRRFAWILLVGVIVQGGLGGLTVLLKLPPATSIVHGLLAQTFFCLSIATAHLLSTDETTATAGRPLPDARLLATRRAALVALLATGGQLLLGLVVRHTVAKGEGHVPTFAQGPVMVHALFAAVVIVAIGRMVTRITAHHFERKNLVRPALAVGLLVMLQIMLGLLAIVTKTAPGITIAHVVTGATILGACLLVWLRTGDLAPATTTEPAR